MAVFSVHLPGAGDGGKRGAQSAGIADAVFLREGFSWPAFLFGPFWLLARGLWVSAALWCAAFNIAIAAGVAGLSAALVLVLLLMIQLLLGLEAQRLVERRLWRKGFDLAEIVAAPALAEAEIDFYRRAGEAAAPQRASPPPMPRQTGAPPVIGSLPAPEA